MLKRLKQLREEKNLSQQKLADEFGISQQSINQYENHDTEPDLAMLKKMADFFDTSIDYIVGYTDVKRKIVGIKENELNQSEEELIQKYRQLNKNHRDVVKTICKMLD